MKILAHMSLIRWTTWHSSLNNIWVHMSYIVGVLHLCCRFLYLFLKKLSYEAQCGCSATATSNPAAPTCCLSGDQHLQARCRSARAATPPTCTCCLTGKKIICSCRPSPHLHLAPIPSNPSNPRWILSGKTSCSTAHQQPRQPPPQGELSGSQKKGEQIDVYIFRFRFFFQCFYFSRGIYDGFVTLCT